MTITVTTYTETKSFFLSALSVARFWKYLPRSRVDPLYGKRYLSVRATQDDLRLVPIAAFETLFHAFNFDLQMDSQGNFYYAKSGQYTDCALPGAIVKVSPDGKTRSIVCTGLRTPNGIRILPDDRLTVSDNQGTWMPAPEVNLVKPGGFYGYLQNKRGGAWAPDGGRIDVKNVGIPSPPLTGRTERTEHIGKAATATSDHSVKHHSVQLAMGWNRNVAGGTSR